MSAICGYWRWSGEGDAQAAVGKMIEAQHLLGRDGSSCWNGLEISVGFQSLEITLEDTYEAQPMQGGSGTDAACPPFRMVADARIFNRAELAAEFGLSGAEAAGMPDSAFVLRAWERWGEGCLDHLVGAFAFAVWEEQAQRLFLACDHAGDRPLYYCRTAQGFSFATTSRSLLTLPGVSGQIDETTLARDLVGLQPQPGRTRYRDVRQIGPGCSMWIERNAVDPVPRRYWQHDRLPQTRFARDEEYIEAFLEIFDEAVRCRLRTSGRIGCELSSGLDSGAITATAAGMMATAEPGRRLTAFTSVPRAGFSGLGRRDCIADEGPFAAEVAALYPNVDHCLVDAAGSDLMQELERSFPLLERPLGAPLNQVWIDLILDRAASAGIKVMLTGAQGNGTISYTGSDIIGQNFRGGHWVKAFRQAYRLRKNGMSSGREAASQTLFSLLPWRLRARFDPSIRSYGLEDVAIRSERDAELGLFDQISRQAFVSEGPLPPMMQTLFHTKGAGDFNSMSLAGWGIETRDPTGDKRVFEFCASIPLEQYIIGEPGRALIRRAMRGRLPEATLKRKMRGAQASDWYECLTPIRGQLAEEIERLETSDGARRLLDLKRLRRAVEQWPKTAKEGSEQSYLYQIILSDGIASGYFIRRSEEGLRNAG